MLLIKYVHKKMHLHLFTQKYEAAVCNIDNKKNHY